LSGDKMEQRPPTLQLNATFAALSDASAPTGAFISRE
jgi:hypothetical protein